MSSIVMTNDSIAEKLGISFNYISGAPIDEHISFAVRNNPKRAHLLVSHILGKHIPTKSVNLQNAVKEMCNPYQGNFDSSSLVIGYAETATSLGYFVAENLNLSYIHSTRYPVENLAKYAFEESHSHATSHYLQPYDSNLLVNSSTVILVDDELTTGNTIINTISTIERISHHKSYYVFTLVDGRSPENEDKMRDFAQSLGITINVVSYSKTFVSLPDNILLKAKEIIENNSEPEKQTITSKNNVTSMSFSFDYDLSHGVEKEFFDFYRFKARQIALSIVDKNIVSGNRILVLGTEELMSFPALISEELNKLGYDVENSSTTLSPIVVIDKEGYPVRDSKSVVIDGTTRFVYNSSGYDLIVLVSPQTMKYEAMAQELSSNSDVLFIELEESK